MFIENKFYNEYMSIVNSSSYTRQDKCVMYLEKHHIIPSSLGGDNSSSNLVYLTAQDHYRCHELLPMFTEGSARSKMLCAWHQMSTTREGIKVDSGLYSILKERNAKRMSHLHKGKFVSRTTRDRQSKSAKGSKHSTETLAKMSGSNHHRFKGYYHTPNGVYTSSRAAGKANNISSDTARKYCYKQSFEGYSFGDYK